MPKAEKSSAKTTSIRSPGRAYAAPALEKGFDIMELLAEAPEGLTIREMSARLHRTISELYRIVIVMERRGWLHRDIDSDKYRVSYKLLEIAHRATPVQDILQAAIVPMRDLAQNIRQSCHLVVRHGPKAFVAMRQENPEDTGFVIRLGATVDLQSSCSGHVLLAFAAIDDDAAPPRMKRRLTEIREKGFEKQESAKISGVTDMSCPVFGFDGRCVAALTVPFLTPLDDPLHMSMDVALEALRQSAERISIALGWYPQPAALAPAGRQG